MRAARRDHVAAIPDMVRALLFKRPPAGLSYLIPEGANIGLYCAANDEAPTNGYIKHFLEAGHRVFLPRFADTSSVMEFAEHTDPFDGSDLESGSFGVLQPTADAAKEQPEVLFVPLIAYTEEGQRLGQGGGHYDRWLADHPGTVAIGIGWDGQLVDALPTEPHDQTMHAIVTPTRIYGPF